MTTSTPSATTCSSNDLPIIVRDRRHRGFYTVDNEIIDQYGPKLKAHGLAVYNVLCRFANREGGCFPSQATIAQRTGMSRMQVSREIEKLKGLCLIEVKPQFGSHGEQCANLYLLCDISKEVPVAHRYTPHTRELYPPVTDSYTPYHRQLHKQDLINKTQREQNIEEQQLVVAFSSPNSAVSKEEIISDTQNERLSTLEPTSVLEPASIDLTRANLGENSLSAAQQTSAAALIAIGLAESVAYHLAEDYNPVYIAEKIEYLAYLQAEHPAQVLRPCGWLRRAIEEDYAAPDGYQSVADRTVEAAERKRWEEEQEQIIAEQREQEHIALAQTHQKAEARLAALYASYGTTQWELDVWKTLLDEFQCSLPAESFFGYVADTILLSLRDGEALIGLPNARARDWLQNRFASKIQRTLASYLEQNVSVKFIEMNPPAHKGGSGWAR